MRFLLPALALALTSRVVYVAPEPVHPANQANPAEVLYGCPTGVLGRWVDNDSHHKDRVDKHFEPSKVQFYDSRKPTTAEQHWTCKVVTK
jgi:hypothetical protein